MTLFDTAAMYAGGASERRLGEFSSDEALIATKFPATLWASANDLPGQLADSLARLRRTASTCTSTTFRPGAWTSRA